MSGLHVEKDLEYQGESADLRGSEGSEPQVEGVDRNEYSGISAQDGRRRRLPHPVLEL